MTMATIRVLLLLAPALAAADENSHWAFQPVVRPAVPAVKSVDRVRNPIDAFVLAKLEAKGWTPAPAAPPAALLRRIHFDIVGLPPTLAEQDAFERDPSIVRLIDELLARPAYGERWARHWLDVVRYADSNGYERDAAKPHVWRYRDYVIAALNSDKPYDRFVLEQLAGDELPDASAETLIAGGYYRLGPWDDEPADPAEDRFDQLDDLIDTTSQAFLGLTLSCARCHAHKFEPLSMRDYYGMAAVFAGLTRPKVGRGELDLPAGSREELARIARRDKRLAELGGEIDRFQAIHRETHLKSGKSKLPPDAVAALLVEPTRRSAAEKTLVAKHFKQAQAETDAALPAEAAAALAHLQSQAAELRSRVPDLPAGYFLVEPSPNPPTMHILNRGKAQRPGAEVPPASPAVLGAFKAQFPSPGPHSSLRRLTLARWIADERNPLTARVMVNRVWQAHFGQGLVRSASDFGIMGDPPSHPELLDWLAAEFMSRGWSLKHLHRLILSSDTYRMSKASRPDYARDDPDNRLLWRMPRQRLEVEAIRDAALSVSGALNPRLYGPAMFPALPKGAVEGSSDPQVVWKPSPEREASRRTVYAFVKRSLMHPMLETLDFSDTARSSPKRLSTTVAPQALTLFNGEFMNRQAELLADRLAREAGADLRRQIELAWRLALSRRPTALELDALAAFVEAETSAARDASPEAARRAALRQACRVILNLNEFVHTD